MNILIAVGGVSVSLIPLLCYCLSRPRYQRIMTFQVVVLIAYFIVFGGYSIDAWRYLTRFTHNPFGFEEEWLFWIVGHSLSEILPNPWPLKILSALAVLLWCSAILRAIRGEEKEARLWAFALLPLMPAFVFTMGNAIRQGLASVIILNAAIFLIAGKKWRFALLSGAGILVHEVSLVFVIAVAAIRVPINLLRVFLLISPFASFVAVWVLARYGIDLSDYVRYSDRDEGSFHYLKFVFYYSAAVGLLFLSAQPAASERFILLSKAFAATVGFASLSLVYEVPFERLALYADVVLPIVLALTIAEVGLSRFLKKWIAAGLCSIGLFFWTSDSVQSTLTEGKAHAQDGRIQFYKIPD